MEKLILELKKLSKKVESYSTIETTATILPSIELCDELELPLTFKCEALHPGTFKGFTLEEHEIVMAKDTVFISEGNFHNYEINKDHKNNRKMDSSVDDVVGRLTESEYDFNKKALILTGKIFDKEIALKMLNGILKYVSLRINPGRIDEENNQTFARDLKFEELSLVRAPGDERAHISEFL